MNAPEVPIFPRDTTQWAAVEVPAWRALTRSALGMGALTGLAVRAFRALALTHGAGADGATPWGYLAGTFAVGMLMLCGMLTLHLANFPVRRWPRRVLAFALAEVAAEALASALLIALGREPLGTSGRAHWHDLPSLAGTTLVVRLATFAAFAALLAAVVQLVRSALARRAPRHLHPAAREP